MDEEKAIKYLDELIFKSRTPREFSLVNCCCRSLEESGYDIKLQRKNLRIVKMVVGYTYERYKNRKTEVN